MKKIVKTLPALGLALAATMAFAFNMPEQGTLKGQVSPGVWEEISPNDLYDCDAAQTICTARFDEQGRMIPNSQVPGQFVEL